MLIILLIALLAPPPSCAATSPDTNRLLVFVNHAPLDLYASAPAPVWVADQERGITATLTLTEPYHVAAAPFTAVQLQSAAPVVLYTCEDGAQPARVFVPLAYSVPSALH